jgi:hypothetical protein
MAPSTWQASWPERFDDFARISSPAQTAQTRPRVNLMNQFRPEFTDNIQRGSKMIVQTFVFYEPKSNIVR